MGATPIKWAWPFKGYNANWPQNEQPQYSTPDCLNVVTNEPQRGRDRGGQRAGTVKAIPAQLGDGASRRIQAMRQVTTTSASEADTIGGGGSSSGLFQDFGAQNTFSLFTNITPEVPMEDDYPTWTAADTNTIAGSAISGYIGALGGTRAGTFSGDGVKPLSSSAGEVLGLPDDAEGVDDFIAAAWQTGNYHATDNFQVELSCFLMGGGTEAFLSCRLDGGNIAGTAATALHLYAFSADGQNYTVELYQGTTLLDSGTVDISPNTGWTNLAIRVVGTAVKAYLAGQEACSSTATTTSSRRAIAFGVRHDASSSTGDQFSVYGSKSLALYTGNDFTDIIEADDFSYTDGQQLDVATLNWDVGTRDGFDNVTEPTITDVLACLDGNRNATSSTSGDAARVNNDGSNPFITMSGDAMGERMATAAFRTADFTPADNFELQAIFQRDDIGGGVGIMARINTANPDADTSGVITGMWANNFDQNSTGNIWDYTIWQGDTLIGSGIAPIKNVSTDQDVLTDTATLKLRIEGQRVTLLVNDFPVCFGNAVGQTTTHRGAGVCVVSFQSGSQAARVRNFEVRTAPAGTETVGGGNLQRDVKLVISSGEDIYTGELGDTFTKIDNAKTGQSRPAMTDLLSKVYLVDPQNPIIVVDPIANTATTLTASSGTAPENLTVCCTWRGRLVVAGQIADPQNVFMSRALDPLNWNYAPATPDGLEAVALNASEAGRIGQPVLALIPYKDDILIIGCDHSIYVLTGDPAAGGTLDAISEAIGILSPNAWAMDPAGRIYFVGTGGFYRMGAEGGIENLALGKVERAFRDIDRRTTVISMAWDRDRNGCWLFLTKSAGGSTHFFFDVKNEAFWPISYPDDFGPGAAIVYDGDAPTDRAILLGGLDGYVRKFDPEQDDDDGTPITSYVFLGPLNPPGEFGKARIIETELTLGLPTNNITYEIRAGQDAVAALAATASASGTLTTSGRQAKIRTRVRGNTFVMRLGQGTAEKSWTFERCSSLVEPGGRIR